MRIQQLFIGFAALLTLSFAASEALTPAKGEAGERPSISLVRLAADRIDAVFRDVAANTRALGDEYRMIAADLAPITEADRAYWIGRATTKGKTVGFRTWSEGKPAPAFEAAFPSYYSYGGFPIADETLAHLRDLERALPLFRAAYNSFAFSWVYLTTADDMMLIYPYVPLDRAINNELPTKQVFYTAADFRRRAVGWTAPYLDLVGAGMMITASYPVYQDDRLLGVVSHDITLKQLSREVLTHLTRRTAAIAFIVDKRGLAIDASDPELEAEIEHVNNTKKAAVLFYRSATGAAQVADPGKTTSSIEWANRITERVLDKASSIGAPGVVDMEIDDRNVVAARIETTGWLVILVDRKM